LIIEWDFLQQTIKSKFSALGAVWASVMKGKYIYCGCEDGSIKIVKAKKKSLELTRNL
jgi:hypothetical protein